MNTDETLAINSSERESLMSLVTTLAADKDVPMTRANEVYELYKKVCDRENEALYNAAMAKAQANMPIVKANRRNTDTGKAFADLCALHEECQKIWTAEGFSVTSSPYDSPNTEKNEVGICLEVMHSAGFTKTYRHEFPLDNAGLRGSLNKTPIQALKSTTTYARRTMELMIFNIATDDDDDGNGPIHNENVPPAEKPIDMKQIENIRTKMREAGVMESDLCIKAGIEKLEQLQQGRIKGCLTWIDSKKTTGENSGQYSAV